MTERVLKVRLIGDATDAARAFKVVDDSAGKSGTSVEGFGSKMTKVGAGMSVGVTLPLLAVGKAAFSAASDMGESLSKVNVVFGESAGKIESWSETAAQSLGISQRAALEAAGTFGNLFSAMGIGAPKAADMSTKIIGLASDLASFNNANPEDVLTALKSGLVGETEPLRAFGVNLNASRIEAEAFAIGLAKPIQNAPLIAKAHKDVSAAQAALTKAQKDHGQGSAEAVDAAAKLATAQGRLEKAMQGPKVELDAAQKAQAAYSLILKDTSLAQGDFARTSDGAANKTRIAKAEFEDLSANLGKSLIPIGTQAIGMVSGLAAGFASLPDGAQTAIVGLAGFAAALGPIMTVGGNVVTLFKSKMGEAVLGFAKDAAVGAARFAVSSAQVVAGWIAQAAAATANAAIVVAGWVATGVAATANAVAGFALMVAGWVASAAQAVVSGAIIVGQWVLQAAAAVANAAIIAASWVVAFWPVALVVAAVVAAGILIVRNWDTIKAAAASVVSFITDKFGMVVDFFRGMPGKIASAASGMWNGITSAFKSAINSVIGLWNRFVSHLKIPSVGVGPFHTPAVDIGSKLRIPMLAAGGTISRGGLTIVGDDGPEIRYMPTGASVIPLDRASGFAGGRPLVVVLELDGREIARATAPHTRTELIRMGLRGKPILASS